MADGPVGDVVKAPIWFTHCVDEADFAPPPEGVGEVFLTGAGVTAKKGCEFLLGGKLVCLGGTRCAVGTIIHIEPVGYDKSGFETIDNDFCVNLLLFPHEVEQFSRTKLENWDQIRHDGIQGELVNREPGDMPKPAEPASEPTPYAVTYLFGTGDPVPYEPKEDATDALEEEIKQDAAGMKRIDIPVLHCEFEGSRAFTVCAALKPFFDLITGGPGAGACRAAIGWIPLIGGLVCSVVEALVALALAPIMAAVAAAAWAASGISDELFLTGPISRQVSLGDPVIVTGRWTWDGGHSGWNEFHPTFTLQRVVLPERTTAGFPSDEARTLVEEWCRLVGEVPPSPGEAASGLVVALTPEQEEVAGRQQRPEHTWEFHPAIDGCLPEDDDGDVKLRR